MKNDLIFDVGMHRGEDTKFYLLKGFRVVAFEANAALCNQVGDQLAAYVSSGQLKIIFGAISESQDPVTFFVSKEATVWGTANPDWVKRNEALGANFTETTVPAVDFRAVLALEGIPYYMKIDIEGSDMLCLHALHHFGSRPRFASIEASKNSFEEVFEQFAAFWSLGYRRFNLVPQHRVPDQRCPVQAREGNYIDHRFEPSSSGLFGEELPGTWVNVADALEAYRKILKKQKLLGDESSFRQAVGLSRALGVEQRSRSLAAREIYRRLRSLADQFGLRPGYYDTHAALDVG